MKSFLISIDTEGDNLWGWKSGDPITTENSMYLERFQALCGRYGFKPTYLTNWEMLQDDRYVSFAKKYVARGECEVGMHLHAWNNPPFHNLPNDDGGALDYLIEYPEEVMEKKIALITERIGETFGSGPITHRAGRWAMNGRYFSLLAKYGYLCDCSVTPGISWSSCSGKTGGSQGSNYTNSLPTEHVVRCQTGQEVVEVPLSTMLVNKIIVPDSIRVKSIARSLKRWIKKEPIQLRPNLRNLNEMMSLVELSAREEGEGYLMFMLHSSELMPGGSPIFSSPEAIEMLYLHLEKLFASLHRHSFTGETIGDYAKTVQKEIIPSIPADEYDMRRRTSL